VKLGFLEPYIFLGAECGVGGDCFDFFPHSRPVQSEDEFRKESKTCFRDTLEKESGRKS
jgi:hypothetical protein